jgi:hypothetical protein
VAAVSVRFSLPDRTGLRGLCRRPVRASDQSDEDSAGRVGQRVDEERDARRDDEQETAQRTGDRALHQRRATDQPAVRPFQPGTRRHRRDHRLTGRTEHDLTGVHHEQHRVQQRNADVPGDDRRGQHRHRHDPDPVDADHQPLAVHPVHQHTTGQREQQPRQPRDTERGGHHQWITGARRDQQWRRDRGQPTTQRRRRAGGPQLREPPTETVTRTRRTVTCHIAGSYQNRQPPTCGFSTGEREITVRLGLPVRCGLTVLQPHPQ